MVIQILVLLSSMTFILHWIFLTSAAGLASIIGSAPGNGEESSLAACPGYKASNIKTSSSSLTADLSLAGKACNVYSEDLPSLTLEVVYETRM